MVWLQVWILIQLDPWSRIKSNLGRFKFLSKIFLGNSKSNGQSFTY